MHARLILTLFAAFAAIRPACGQAVIAYDPFNEAPGSLNGGASAGVPWPTGANWQFAFGNGGTVVSSSLSYGTLQTTGNKSQFAWFAGDNASIRSLGSNRGGAPADFWISFLANFNQPGQGLYLYFNTTPEMQIGAPPSGGGQLGLDLYNGVTNTGTQTLLAVPGVNANGTTHLFAVHFQLGSAGATNSISLTVDPNVASLGTGSAPTGGSTVTFGAATNFAFEQFLIGNVSGVTGAAGTFNLDEIRLGPTWQSVSPVPEPSAWLLCAAGIGFSLRRLRRAGAAAVGI